MAVSEKSRLNGAYAATVDESRPKPSTGIVALEVTLTGASPLLMNAMSQEQLLDIRNKVKKPKNAAKPSPKDEAQEKVYRTADGTPCVPSRMLYACLIGAGQYVRLDGKRQVSTATKTILPGMLLLLDFELPLFVPGESDKATWETDIQQGRNPNGGEAVCVIRPRFDQWEVRATLELDQDQMPMSMARELIDRAGRMVGIGDFRPQRRGSFGRFVVTSWNPKK